MPMVEITILASKSSTLANPVPEPTRTPLTLPVSAFLRI
jgi:hypothetical protein